MEKGGCLVSSLSMARFKDTNNVLALDFVMLVVVMVMAGSLNISGLSARNACQRRVLASHGSMLPPDYVFART
jgi:hypothetical protein